MRLLSRTKLYWGLAIICLIGALASPHSSSGRNIFLSFNNLTDVLRQVSITGLVATGMTLVILLGGIDLSVGSVMGFSTIICAMLLTQPGWTPAAIMAVPAARDRRRARGRLSWLGSFFTALRADATWTPAGETRSCWTLGAACAFRRCSASSAARSSAVATCVAGFDQIRRARRAACDPCVALGARRDQRRAHRRGPAPALHRHARDDGQRAGPRPPHRGPGQRGHRGLHGHERHRRPSKCFARWCGASCPCRAFFSWRRSSLFGAVLRFTTFGRYIYAIGGNPEAAKLSGIKVAQVQLAAYLISSLLAGLAGVLFVAQYRQGKPDAGSGLELDAIAAVVIGGTSLMGGRGGLAGTFVGVLIFGLLSDILQLQNIDSNVQLLMKGLIIVGTVLVQEQNLGQLLTRWRSQAPRRRRRRTGSAESHRPPASRQNVKCKGGSP